MGFFGTYLYDQHGWKIQQPGASPEVAEPWLMLDIHDSDVATVTYRPAGPGSGTAFLGCTPRTYFADESASAPTDVNREAAGLATWWAHLRDGVSDAERDAKCSQILGYLAEDGDPECDDWDEDEDVDEFDDGDIFVEATTVRFLTALDLPIPDDLLIWDKPTGAESAG
ncbi:MAG TPA: hypothetical protein VF054_18235 [Micromonosporaceae bacterium]